MIDYRAHIAALNEFRQWLAATSISDPKIAAIRAQHLTDVAAAPEMAMLGSLIDHLIWHAASDGTELDLVQRAANLWKQGLSLFKSLAEFRADLESALSDPSNPNSVTKFNAATQKFYQMALTVTSKAGEIASLRKDVSKFAHVPPHPRQQDLPLASWSWKDVFIGRRTDAFTRSVRKLATAQSTSAFAFGVLASYGGNVCGSAYLGQVVGGPRRSHRHRDRLARNTVGSWVARSRPSLPALKTIASSIRYGPAAAPRLPSGIENLIRAAMADAFDLSRCPPLPDFQRGYRKLIRHLELLDTIVMPDSPAMPIEPFLSTLFGDPSNPHVSIFDASVGVSSASPGLGSGSGSGTTPQNAPSGSSPNTTDSPTSAGDACGAFWEGILLGIILLVGGFIYCMGMWVQGQRCKLFDQMVNDFKKAFSPGQGAQVSNEPPEAITAYGLTVASQVDQMTTLVGHMFDLHTFLWEALDKAYDFLAVYGLIYPDGRLQRARFAPLLSVPVTPPGSWPHLQPADSINTLHKYPGSATEQPASAMNYPPLATPEAFLTGVPGNSLMTSVQVSTSVWQQMAANVTDAENYDMDADRALQHPCWTVSGSINNKPLNVIGLPYAET